MTKLSPTARQELRDKLAETQAAVLAVSGNR